MKRFTQGLQRLHVGGRAERTGLQSHLIVQDTVIFKRMAQQNALFITAASL